MGAAWPGRVCAQWEPHGLDCVTFPPPPSPPLPAPHPTPSPAPRGAKHWLGAGGRRPGGRNRCARARGLLRDRRGRPRSPTQRLGRLVRLSAAASGLSPLRPPPPPPQPDLVGELLGARGGGAHGQVGQPVPVEVQHGQGGAEAACGLGQSPGLSSAQEALRQPRVPRTTRSARDTGRWGARDGKVWKPLGPCEHQRTKNPPFTRDLAEEQVPLWERGLTWEPSRTPWASASRSRSRGGSPRSLP